MNCYIHFLPGRLRVRTDFLRKNELGAYALRKGIASLEGVRSFGINTTTGSVLILFDGTRLSIQTLLAKLAQHHAIPLLEGPSFLHKPDQVLRIWVESKPKVVVNLWPILLKKAGFLILGALEIQPVWLHMLVSYVVPHIVEVQQ